MERVPAVAEPRHENGVAGNGLRAVIDERHESAGEEEQPGKAKNKANHGLTVVRPDGAADLICRQGSRKRGCCSSDYRDGVMRSIPISSRAKRGCDREDTVAALSAPLASCPCPPSAAET